MVATEPERHRPRRGPVGVRAPLPGAPRREHEAVAAVRHDRRRAAGCSTASSSVRPCAPGVANRLVSGIDDVDSARIAQEQWKLSRVVADDPSLTALFDGGVERLAGRMEGTALARPLERFLADVRASRQRRVRARHPGWDMDPRPVLAAVERLRHVPAERSTGGSARRLVAERASPSTRLASTCAGRCARSRCALRPCRGPVRWAANAPRTSSCSRTSGPSRRCTSWPAAPPSAAVRRRAAGILRDDRRAARLPRRPAGVRRRDRRARRAASVTSTTVSRRCGSRAPSPIPPAGRSVATATAQVAADGTRSAGSP